MDVVNSQKIHLKEKLQGKAVQQWEPAFDMNIDKNIPRSSYLEKISIGYK